MEKTLKFFLLLCFVLCLSDVTAADKQRIVLKTDTSAIRVLSVPAKKLAHYRESRAFNYRSEEPVNFGFLAMLKSKFVKLLESVMESKLSQIGFYVLFIGLFVVLVASFIGVDVQSIFRRNKASEGFVQVFEDGKIESIDFQLVIDHEINQGNYNRAVRFLYLKLLQDLTRKELIVWQKEKVNRDYFKEMLNSGHFADFKSITNTYEYVWYGKFPLKQTDFEIINLEFIQFFKLLNA